MAKIKVANPVVEPAGDAMARSMPGFIGNKPALPYLDLDHGYYDPGTGGYAALASGR